MSSPTFHSSPLTPRRTRRKSRFTYKHLSTLSQSSPSCPLRVIAHIDLDAFYAQCETVRLGIDPGKPLAVQQWQGLIAINYPARAFGLSRHVTITEAKEKCPGIICQHVATWKEGDTKWTYELEGTDAAREIATRKVSLDPYRIQSRRILATIKAALPPDTQRVEKASIDEVFLDLSAQVHATLLQRYPELHGPAPYDDPTEPLPRPPTTALDWAADALVDLDASQSEEDDPDWDDISLLIASEIVRDVRKKIFDDLHYTCSAGLSKNKMLAKLGSAHHKPNGQTVIRNRATQHFLSGMKFTKIRGLGGRFGDEVVSAFHTESISELLPITLDQLKKALGDESGTSLYSTLRGEDTSEVNPRTQIKSMLSAKSFRPSINSFEVAGKWLRIFGADIFSRLVEEGVLEFKRRPRTINLMHRQGGGTRSRQAPIPQGRVVSEDVLFELAKNLLAQVVGEGRAWPCANLSLSVGGFEDGVANNKGIGGFLVHGEEAKALREQPRGKGRGEERPLVKRRRVVGDEGVGITRFFGARGREESSRGNEVGVGDEDDGEEGGGGQDVADRRDQGDEQDELYTDPDHEQNEQHELSDIDPDAPASSASLLDQVYPADDDDDDANDDGGDASRGLKSHDHNIHHNNSIDSDRHLPLLQQQSTQDLYLCPRCTTQIPAAEKVEHEDFHFAQDLQDEGSSQPPPRRRPPELATDMARPGGGGSGSGGGTGRGRGRGRGRPPAMERGPERGQRRLAFG
ncbi:DNA-directed DNA polymerase eta rad30 [Recurvomyces mirabilis]|nr:DNA-directed DNA polymerase eta rad30 [Recurvomyces mirabilis]